ncbi:CHAT domain-containing protein [Archangium violaceum]|uniref:CHAT domain-containing protein n=1 Tax=Archangium violaceum TaxID=83451 RepID=UPI00193B0674|nr:CHAT domain-containing protein [Archangium violaceum]QRK08584.1 CHAT domain-containing protein [Archangium violaceum]
MEQGIEQAIRHHLAEAIRRRSAIIWTPGSNVVAAVMEALVQATRGASLNLSRTGGVVRQAVDLLFSETTVTEAELIEALRDFREELDANPILPFKSRSHLCLLFLVMVLQRAGESQQLSPSAQVSLLLEAQELEESFSLQGELNYRIRLIVLDQLKAAFEPVSDQVRHMDLVVRLNGARCEAFLVAQPSSGFALEDLQSLVEDTRARIQETHDGEEDGLCPKGQPVRPERKVRRMFRAGELLVIEPYHSLPRLLAEALNALGRAFVESPLETHTRNFEQAFQAFHQAHEIFVKTGEMEAAVHSAVCAVECLERLAQLDSDVEQPFKYQMKAYDLGRALCRWVRELPLPEPVSMRWAALLEAAFVRSTCWGGLMRMEHLAMRAGPETEREEQQERIIEEALLAIRAHAFLVCRNASEHPWEALTHACAVAAQAADFLEEVIRKVLQGESPREKDQRIRDRVRDVLRPLLGEDFVQRLLEALSLASRSLWTASSKRGPAGPLACPVRLYEAVAALWMILVKAQLPLTGIQLKLLNECLSEPAMPFLPVKSLLELAGCEFGMLGWALHEGEALEEVLTYVEKRLSFLNEQLAWPLLSASERTLLSDWMARLIHSVRLASDDLASVAPERVLALLDLTGASAFRMESLFYGQGEAKQWMDFTSNNVDSMSNAVRRTASAVSVTDLSSIFSNLYSARADLDGWGRLKMIHEAGRESWTVQAMFSELLKEQFSRVTILPPDASPSEMEYMERITGVPRERWERREDGVLVVRQSPSGLEEIGEYVGRARQRLLECHDYLASRGLLPDGVHPPRATPEGVSAFLSTHPCVAILVPGMFPEIVTPMSVFLHHDGRLQRHVIGSLDDISERAPGAAALSELYSALAKDLEERSPQSWQELEQVFERMCSGYASWARQLAEVLDRHGITDVLILHRGHQQVFLSWEDLRIAPEGPRLGERYRMGHLHTLAPLPGPFASEPQARQGVVQLHGDGLSGGQMAVARAVQESLASHGCARPPLSGREATDAQRLYRELRTARRVRLFLHGHHDRLNPEADRITLVDAEQREDWINLRGRELRRLPLSGVDCVELWACQGASHGRALADHGPAEEPEDVSAAFLLAGARRVVASRWHVPTLPGALLMERFALLVETGLGEAEALQKARDECRTLFRQGGRVERAVVGQVGSTLKEWGSRAHVVHDHQLHQLLEEAMERCLRDIRAEWYGNQSGQGPRAWPSLEGATGRLVSFSAPRPERLAASLRQFSEAQAEQLVADYLRFYRSPMCWAGWRLMLRTLEDWRG